MLNRNLRLINVVLGVWVVISALVWRRSGGSFINNIVTGIVIIVSALAAIRRPELRFVNAAAGIWLVASLFAWPNYSSPMVWNDAIVGAGVALVSLVGPEQADMITS
jgi:hypothetical protein